jgi:hypothetical protein
MLAYKFRSASQIEYVFDILLNRRLFCSDWRKLNDPMEGMFVSAYDGERPPHAHEAVMGIREAKGRYKVASLAGTFDCHLLWAHYAGGFDGVAIEVDLPDDDPMIRYVDYRGVFAYLDLTRIQDEEQAAQTILFSKYEEWRYEREVRILSDREHYELTRPICRVIAGHRMGKALFDALHLICDKVGIEMCRVGIGDEGIDADHLPAPRLKRYRKPRARPGANDVLRRAI